MKTEPGHDDELFDEILYRLDGAFFAGPTLDDEKTKYAIAGALMKVPEEVREFALTELLFAATGNASYYVRLEHITRQQQFGKKCIVFLVSVGVEGKTAEDVESIAAHEIAHAWLGHGELEDARSDAEVRAAELVKKWGFSGPGTRPSWSPMPRESE